MIIDWSELERVLHDGVVQAVNEPCRTVALAHIYREQDGQIALPLLGVSTTDPGEPDDYRTDWLPADLAAHWENALTAAACAGTTRHWHRTFERYLTVLVRVCRKATKTLRANGKADRECVVVLLDDEFRETLIRRVLTAADVRRHFPELDERSAELARIAALPPVERGVHLTSLLGRFDGPVTGEDAEVQLRELGAAAFPALLDVLRDPGRSWQAAKILADIGQADDDVIHALDTELPRADAADQQWIAAALSRLGHLDLVLTRANTLPVETVASAIAAPYTSFRNDTACPAPLDYRPLAEAIENRPTHTPALAQRLAPGSGYCEITPDEADTAIEALASPHPIIRRHAVGVLGNRALGKRIGQRVLPALANTARNDPDASVRRLAITSLLFWHRDSRHLANLIREALTDPDPQVRATAQHWLDEQIPTP